MIAVNLDRITVTYVLEPVFENLSWEIHDDRVVGLVGPNGCGKSTLLRLIADELTSDSGFTIRRKGLKLGYLRQEPRLKPGRTVRQEALSASVGIGAAVGLCGMVISAMVWLGLGTDRLPVRMVLNAH